MCISLKLNLLKGTVWQIKLEAAGIVMRTLASCPCWFEWVSATSNRVGCPTANKAKRGWRWEEVAETRRKWSSRETNGKYVCVLNQRFRQQERAQSQTIVSERLCRFLPSVFTFSSSFFGRESRLSLCCFVSQCFSSRSNTLLHLTLSGMLEQHWGSYICRHAWAPCCRSPKPAVNQGLDQVVM